MTADHPDPTGRTEPDGPTGPPSVSDEPTVRLNFASVERGTPLSSQAPTQPTSAEYRPDLGGTPPPKLPTLPGYDVAGVLGRGGMGIVLRAVQRRLNRPVAIKMLLHEDVSSPADVARFASEAEAVAAIRHPHVVQVYESGQHNGRPYFVMEFLPGGTLHGRLRADGPFPPDAAAELVEKLARAVLAAHSQGIVHRDLKPGNVLFDAAGEPRVTDFGLAKRSAQELTRTQAVMGTPAYMPPEQAAGRAKFAGPPADIYALGVILYECLTGRTPFQHEDSVVLMQRVIHEPPPSLRTRVPGVPRDLELICLKCLEKEPADRDPTAGALADDLRHHLNREPVSVRPAGPLERAVKWARRRPTAAAAYGLAAVAAFLLLFGGGLTVLLWQTAQARDAADLFGQQAVAARDELAAKNAELEQAQAAEAEQRHAAEKARDDIVAQKKQVDVALAGETAAKRAAVAAREELEREKYFRNVAFAHTELNDGHYLRAIQLLDDCPADRRGWEWWHTYRAAHPATGSGQSGGLIPLDIAFAPTWSGVITGHTGSQVTRFDFKDGSGTPAVLEPTHGTVAIPSADGKRVLIGRDWAKAYPDALVVRDLATNKQLAAWPGPKAARLLCGLSPTGERVVVKFQGEPVRVYDVASGKELSSVPADVPLFCRGQFSADGRVVIVPTTDGAVAWEADTGRVIRAIKNEGGRITSVQLDPAGKIAVTGSDTGELRGHSLATGKAVTVPRAHVGPITAIAVCPLGKVVATAGEDGAVRFWDPGTAQMVREFVGHLRPVTGINFDPKGTTLAACDAGGVFRLWPVYEPASAITRWPVGKHMTTAFASDREVFRLFAADGGDRGVVWERKANREYPITAPPGARFTAAAVAEKGLTHVVGTDRGHVFLCADYTATPKLIGQLPAPVGTLRFTPDGRRLLAASDRECLIWETEKWEGVFRLHFPFPVERVAHSPDGRWLAFYYDVNLVVYDTRDKTSYELRHEDRPSAVGFTRDGKQLLVGTRGWTVYRYPMAKVREKTQGQGEQRPLLAERLYHGHSAAVTAFDVSPDGKRLAAGAADGMVRVWDFETGLQAVSLTTDQKRRTPVSAVWFTADGLGLIAQPEDAPPVAFDGAPMPLLHQPTR